MGRYRSIESLKISIWNAGSFIPSTRLDILNRLVLIVEKSADGGVSKHTTSFIGMEDLISSAFSNRRVSESALDIPIAPIRMGHNCHKSYFTSFTERIQLMLRLCCAGAWAGTGTDGDWTLRSCSWIRVPRRRWISRAGRRLWGCRPWPGCCIGGRLRWEGRRSCCIGSRLRWEGRRCTSGLTGDSRPSSSFCPTRNRREYSTVRVSGLNAARGHGIEKLSTRALSSILNSLVAVVETGAVRIIRVDWIFISPAGPKRCLEEHSEPVRNIVKHFYE